MSDKLVPPLTKKDVKELQTLFDEYDDDGSGELELEELTTMMRSLGKYLSIESALCIISVLYNLHFTATEKLELLDYSGVHSAHDHNRDYIQ